MSVGCIGAARKDSLGKRQVVKLVSIAVCDDEIVECCDIARKIKDVLERKKVPCMIRQFGSGQELLRTAEDFDIIFLDILMQGLDGMQTARIFRKKAFDRIIIFLSSSRDYVFEAYDVEAFQYLLKPLDGKKLEKALERALLKTESRSQEFLVVSKERQKVKLFLDDIYYFEIRGRQIKAHGTEGNVTYYGKIGDLELALLGKGFYRCHKSYLINLKHVDGYNRQEAFLDNGEGIVIARKRYEGFCGEVLAYMRGHGGIL